MKLKARWIWITIWNLCLTIILFFLCISFFHFYYIQKPHVTRALSLLERVRETPHFNSQTQKAGVLPDIALPSYLTQDPDPNKIKVGCFGDSHTAGDEVSANNSYPFHLQELLGPQYQVFNFGRGGYNSNQIYEILPYFTEAFDLDIIVLGPRGFYADRASTFNNYWNFSQTPYSRFIIQDQQLSRIEVPGQSLEEKTYNYYSVFPEKNLLYHDMQPPSFLKFFSFFTGQYFLNPFIDSEKKIKESSKVQIMQIEDMANRLNRKIIHLTDDWRDEIKFKNVSHPKYKFEYTKSLLNLFPYRAEVSHPSAFGNYVHALAVREFITGQRWKLFSVEDATPLERFDLNLPPQSPAGETKINSIAININGIDAGEMKAIKTQKSSIGEVFTHADSSAPLKADQILIGFHFKNHPVSGSFFVKTIKPKKFIFNIKIESIKKIPHANIYLVTIESGKFNFTTNSIELFEQNLPKVITLDNHPILKHQFGKTYSTSLPTFKMVINKDINIRALIPNGSMKLTSKIDFKE